MEKYRILIKGIVKYGEKYLIVERWHDDRIVDPYQWEFIDGELEFGESPDKGVIRIIHESTGLNAEISKILYTWSFMIGDVCNIGISYLCLTADLDVILSEDLNSCKWVNEDELEQYIENKAVLKDLEKSQIE